MLICEGRTDFIYIESALRRLSSRYPLLVKEEEGEKVFTFRRLKHFGSRTCQLLGIKDGGTGDITEFIKLYRKESKSFPTPRESHPIIIVLDNDDAGEKVIKAAKNACNVTGVNQDSPYLRVHRNVYIVRTSTKSEKSDIEDLFDESTLSSKVEGKSFDRSNRSKRGQGAKTYGKMDFAKEVVEKNRDSINFDGFIPLLDAISEVVKAHNRNRKRQKS